MLLEINETTTDDNTLPLSLYPLEDYDQNIDHWLDPNANDYDKPLLSNEYTQARAADFARHLYQTDDKALSSWSEQHVTCIITGKLGADTFMKNALERFNNQHRIKLHLNYSKDFRPVSDAWFNQMLSLLPPINDFQNIQYDTAHRAIVIENIQGRTLPSNDPIFYHYSIAGEGYPIDNLQETSLWVGTPIYVLTQSIDKAWSFVIADDNMMWIPSQSLALATDDFITQWQQHARHGMIAITKTQAVIKTISGTPIAQSYVGTLLPLVQTGQDDYHINIPSRDLTTGNAMIQQASISQADAAPFPLALTKRNFASIIKTLINRPYGWGGMYFYNDCSQELKSLFAPFGIWLGRNSNQQLTAGKIDDASQLSPEDRISYLQTHGIPLLTLVHVNGHVFLYMGQHPDPKQPNCQVSLTYQNVWGLNPEHKNHRLVIGKSLLLPLTPEFSKDKMSRPLFQLIQLDPEPR